MIWRSFFHDCNHFSIVITIVCFLEKRIWTSVLLLLLELSATTRTDLSGTSLTTCQNPLAHLSTSCQLASYLLTNQPSPARQTDRQTGHFLWKAISFLGVTTWASTRLTTARLALWMERRWAHRFRLWLLHDRKHRDTKGLGWFFWLRWGGELWAPPIQLKSEGTQMTCLGIEHQDFAFEGPSFPSLKSELWTLLVLFILFLPFRCSTQRGSTSATSTAPRCSRLTGPVPGSWTTQARCSRRMARLQASWMAPRPSKWAGRAWDQFLKASLCWELRCCSSFR